MRDNPFKGHIPRKRFGQHFLIDPAIIQAIIQAVNIKPTDHIVEIGPGLGALTEPVLEKANRLDCIEIDRDLAEKLRQNFGAEKNFSVIQQDALQFDLFELNVPDKSLRIIGNLPYNITTPLLFHLIQFSSLIQDMHFMLQKEVVDRITAVPGTKSFGRLSLMIQYFCKTDYLFSVPPQAFLPPPKVQSAILRLTPYEQIPHPVQNFSLFEKLTECAFSKRRKMISNSLKDYVTDEDFAVLNINPTVRAETLSLQNWVTLCNYISKKATQ